jgi:hypothetical protein
MFHAIFRIRNNPSKESGIESSEVHISKGMDFSIALKVARC